jgi:hypothetical protein
VHTTSSFALIGALERFSGVSQAFGPFLGGIDVFTIEHWHDGDRHRAKADRGPGTRHVGQPAAAPQDDNLDRGEPSEGMTVARVMEPDALGFAWASAARRPADDARVNWRKVKKLGRGDGGGAAREIGGPRLHVPYNHGLLRV